MSCVEMLQVADDLGESIRILKVDTDENPALSTQLQVGRDSCQADFADAG